jgi:hypothetical protein
MRRWLTALLLGALCLLAIAPAAGAEQPYVPSPPVLKEEKSDR